MNRQRNNEQRTRRSNSNNRSPTVVVNISDTEDEEVAGFSGIPRTTILRPPPSTIDLAEEDERGIESRQSFPPMASTSTSSSSPVFPIPTMRAANGDDWTSRMRPVTEARIRKMEEAAQKLKNENAALQRRVASAEAEDQIKDNKAKQMQEELESLQQRVAQADAANEEKTKEIDAMREDNAYLQQRRKKIEQLKDELATQKAEVENLQRKFSQEKEKSEEVEKKLEEELHRVQKELADEKVKFFAILNDTQAQQKSQVDLLEQTLNQRKKEVIDKEHEINELRVFYAEIESGLKLKLADAELEYEATINRLKQDKEQNLTLLEKQKDCLKKAEAVKKELQEENASLLKENERLESLVEDHERIKKKCVQLLTSHPRNLKEGSVKGSTAETFRQSRTKQSDVGRSSEANMNGKKNSNLLDTTIGRSERENDVASFHKSADNSNLPSTSHTVYDFTDDVGSEATPSPSVMGYSNTVRTRSGRVVKPKPLSPDVKSKGKSIKSAMTGHGKCFSCDECTSSFGTKRQLNSHKKTCHSLSDTRANGVSNVGGKKRRTDGSWANGDDTASQTGSIFSLPSI